MGREALLESLRTTAVEDREAVWRDARAAADKYRGELGQAAEAERARVAQSAAEASHRLARDAVGEARRRAREQRANAARQLAERCRGLAQEELPRLRVQGDAALFRALADELPALRWTRVQVNPADLDPARQCYPQSEVVADAGISGGLAVETEGGRIRVSNTLDTRLGVAWPDLIPILVGKLLPEAGDEPPAA
jgi:vacuolar-type H+-ATPase subunit E/Vma4